MCASVVLERSRDPCIYECFGDVVLRKRGRKGGGGEKTHDEIDVLNIGMALEFERELVEIPNAHLGLVCPSSDDMMAVARALDAVAGLGELKVL